MEARDIEVERSQSGIFTYAQGIVLGQTTRVLIWGVTGENAGEYRTKSDDELRQIAYSHWKRMNISIRRRKQDGAG
jgi:hypothetical protein